MFSLLILSVTDTTGEGVIIFPLSSIAFMIITFERVLKADQGEISVDPDILDRCVKAVLDERNVPFCRNKCVRIYDKFIATVNIALLSFRIQRFNQLHRRAFVILVACRIGSQEIQTVGVLQRRFG